MPTWGDSRSQGAAHAPALGPASSSQPVARLPAARSAASTRKGALPFQRCCRRKREDLRTPSLDLEDGSGMALQPRPAAPGGRRT